MKQENLIIVLIVTIIFLFGAILYFFVPMNGVDQQVISDPKVTRQQTPDQSKTVSLPGDVPLDWKTYKNEKYGFEFQQPKDWEVDMERTDSSAVVFINKKSEVSESREAISFEINDKNLSLDQFVSNFSKLRDYKEQQIKRDYQIKIGGEKTAQIETNEFGLTLYIFIHKGTIFTIETQSLFTDDVLETFMFAN